MTGAKAHAGQYPGLSRGNFRHKASLESSNNLTHNVFASLPGQTGKDVEHRPEQLDGMLRHNNALLAARTVRGAYAAGFIEGQEVPAYRGEHGVAVAQLARRRTWTVMRLVQRATGVQLTLRSGRRSVTVHVPVCITGPDLSECGLRSVALPPSQRVLALQPGGER